MRNINNQPKWSLSEEGSCLCIGSGLLFFSNKKPQGINYEEIMQMIKANPNNDCYVKSHRRTMTLGKALELNAVDKLGQQVVFTTTINIHTIIRDRDFEDWPQTGKELLEDIYESKPYEVDET